VVVPELGVLAGAATMVIRAGLSLVLLIVFWDARLFIGVIISLVLIALAVARPKWIKPIGA
jgi:hypothetical protein